MVRVKRVKTNTLPINNEHISKKKKKRKLKHKIKKMKKNETHGNNTKIPKFDIKGLIGMNRLWSTLTGVSVTPPGGF